MLPVRIHDFGWHPDLPDHRDYHLGHEAVVALLRKIKIRTRKAPGLPESVDWREYCGPVEDQQQLSTCTAHACVALVQQLERRASGRLLQPSRLFAHQSACRLQMTPRSSGLSLRSVLKAIVRCGVPPERHWAYDSSHFERDPDPFTYCFQQEFRMIRYLRLDDRASAPADLLPRLKSLLAAGFPFAFGFMVCSTISDDPGIAFPTAADRVLGGQAVVAVGYDNKLRIRSDRGALLVRNSWGTNWGDGGFGWLPYSYVLARLAVDFWTLLKPAWLRSDEFELPR
jgi:C1A family cysteine protease